MHTGQTHHYHVRKRVHKKLEPFPSESTLKRYVDKLMFAIAVLGPVVTIPQLFQILETKDVKGLSLFTWLMWSFFSFVWLVYGMLHRDIPLIVSQALYLAINVAITVAIFAYA